jgi:hypothetical protein
MWRFLPYNVRIRRILANFNLGELRNNTNQGTGERETNIIEQLKKELKLHTDKLADFVNLKANMLIGNLKEEDLIFHGSNMKRTSTATQNRAQAVSNKSYRESRVASSEGHQKGEGLSGGKRRTNRKAKSAADERLKKQTFHRRSKRKGGHGCSGDRGGGEGRRGLSGRGEGESKWLLTGLAGRGGEKRNELTFNWRCLCFFLC